MGRRWITIAVGLLAALAIALAVGVLRLRSRQIAPSPHAPLAVDKQRVAGELAEAVRIATLSLPPGESFDPTPFEALQRLLTRLFPRVHAQLELERVAGHSLLYRWPGRDPGWRPVLLLAHQDVVPIARPQSWTHPPFSGAIVDGFVWGRGALDAKSIVVAQLHAVELLLRDGFTPERDVYFAYGHDEELGGHEGARSIAALLRERGIEPEFSLDEGLMLANGLVPGVDRPVALIGIAEKGSLTLRLEASASGGHASIPPARTAIGALSRALVALERTPPPVQMGSVVEQSLDFLAPEMDPLARVLFGNRWLFGPLIQRELLASPNSAALLRTTTAPTVLRAGVKHNVLPERAEALLNFRIRPGETVASVTEHVRRVVTDPDVSISVQLPPIEPSPVSRVDAPGFHAIQRAVADVFPDALAAPFLMIAGTDTKHYVGVVDDAYRFVPWRFEPEDLARVHGANERIALDDLADLVRFYARVLRYAAGDGRLATLPR